MRSFLKAVWAIEPMAAEQLRGIPWLRGEAAVCARAAGKPRKSGEGNDVAALVDTVDLRGANNNDAGQIGVVNIFGVLAKGAPEWAEEYGFLDTLKVTRAITQLTADDRTRAIVLRIDSPGGSVDGLAELGDAVYAARNVKPIVAQVDGMAASAAYYVASQADRIMAGRMDMIGSIGTRLLLFDYSKLFDRIGIRSIPIDSAPEDRPYKSAGAIGTVITDQQVADFQRFINEFFADFKAMVLRGRNMASDAFDAIADGRMWTGPEAMKLGLIDGFATVDATIGELGRAIETTDRARRAAG